MQLWPILGKIVELPQANVFMIGIYAGPCNPESVNNYMHDFIEDVKKVTKTGSVFMENTSMYPFQMLLSVTPQLELI